MMQRRENRPVMTALLAMLARGEEVTARTLAEHTGINQRNARRYIELAVELGHAHIAGWVRYGARGRSIPKLGAGKAPI